MKRFYSLIALSVVSIGAINQVVISSLAQALEMIAQLSALAQTNPAGASPVVDAMIDALRDFLTRNDLVAVEDAASLLAQLADIEVALASANTTSTITTSTIPTTMVTAPAHQWHNQR